MATTLTWQESSKGVRPLIDFFVLDALANDLESLEDILRLINRDDIGWRQFNRGRPYERSEVLAPLLRCIREGLIDVFSLESSGKSLSRLPSGALPPSSLDLYWFGLTPAGRLVHTNWNPPALADGERDRAI